MGICGSSTNQNCELKEESVLAKYTKHSNVIEHYIEKKQENDISKILKYYQQKKLDIASSQLQNIYTTLYTKSMFVALLYALQNDLTTDSEYDLEKVATLALNNISEFADGATIELYENQIIDVFYMIYGKYNYTAEQQTKIYLNIFKLMKFTISSYTTSNTVKTICKLMLLILKKNPTFMNRKMNSTLILAIFNYYTGSVSWYGSRIDINAFYELAEYLIKQDFELIYTQYSDGTTILSAALSQYRYILNNKMVFLILDNDAKKLFNARTMTSEGRTILTYAHQTKNYDVIHYLTNQSKIIENINN
jgi:hypothetical protein